MMSPLGMALAAITVMLWILWSDTLRRQRVHPIHATIRVALYLVMSGILILNLVRYSHLYNASARVFTVLAALIGLVGAAYFGRKLVRRV